VSHSMGVTQSTDTCDRFRSRKPRSLTVALFIALSVMACSPKTPQRHQMAAIYPSLAENPRPTPDPYVLQVGDELAIKFYTNPELNEDVKIRPDGMISMQLIDDVVAAGRSPAELDAELTRRYTGELADPQISVIVRKAGLNRVYIDGEVGKPGVVTIAGGMTLYQAIQRAGGLLETAHRKQIILIRKGADGQPVGTIVDIRPIQSGENPAVDVPLRPLDMVFVPRSKIAQVDLFVKQYIRDALPIQTFPIPAF
jgi:protein involved in polysaccharide export with SLBB domain